MRTDNELCSAMQVLLQPSAKLRRLPTMLFLDVRRHNFRSAGQWEACRHHCLRWNRAPGRRWPNGRALHIERAMRRVRQPWVTDARDTASAGGEE